MDNFTSNPRQFMTQLGNLTNLLKRVGESVEASYNPLGFESRLPEFGSEPTFDPVSGGWS